MPTMGQFSATIQFRHKNEGIPQELDSIDGIVVA